MVLDLIQITDKLCVTWDIFTLWESSTVKCILLQWCRKIPWLISVFLCCMLNMLIAWSGLMKRKTMVLDLDETLIHSHHDGWVGLLCRLFVGSRGQPYTRARVHTHTPTHTHMLPVCITDPINQYHQLLHQTLYLEWVNSYCTMGDEVSWTSTLCIAIQYLQFETLGQYQLFHYISNKTASVLGYILVSYYSVMLKLITE